MREPEIRFIVSAIKNAPVETIERASVVVGPPQNWSRWSVKLLISGKHLFKDLLLAEARASTKEEADNIALVIRDLCIMKKGV